MIFFIGLQRGFAVIRNVVVHLDIFMLDKESSNTDITCINNNRNFLLKSGQNMIKCEGFVSCPERGVLFFILAE